MSDPLADVRCCCGRLSLFVADIAIAMEGDRCRTSQIPEDVAAPIPSEELERASIGGKPAKDLPMEVVRFFRGDNWHGPSLEWVAKKINEAAESRLSHQSEVIKRLREALKPVNEEIREKVDLRGPGINPNYHIELTITQGECLAIRSALAFAEGQHK